MGWWLAGWDVVGVDWRPQQHYPFPFVEADVMALDLGALVDSVRPARVGSVIVAASPPCQRWSTATPAGLRHAHPDLVTPMRRRLSSLVASSRIDGFVMENVPGAPLVNAVQICGGGLGLGVRRHRLFESSFPLWGVPCAHGRRVVSVVGGYGGPRRGRYVTADEGREAMGAPWMPWPALTQSIPPAYTEFLGRQVAEALGLRSRDDSPSTSGNRHVEQLRPRCFCGVELVASVTGRWPLHCTHACRQRAYRRRLADLAIYGEQQLLL